jgi:hypothetical protein
VIPANRLYGKRGMCSRQPYLSRHSFIVVPGFVCRISDVFSSPLDSRMAFIRLCGISTVPTSLCIPNKAAERFNRMSFQACLPPDELSRPECDIAPRERDGSRFTFSVGCRARFDASDQGRWCGRDDIGAVLLPDICDGSMR